MEDKRKIIVVHKRVVARQTQDYESYSFPGAKDSLSLISEFALIVVQKKNVRLRIRYRYAKTL